MLAFPNAATGAVRVLDLRTGRTRWRLPGGAISGSTLVHQDGQLLTWFNLATGARTGDAVLKEHARFVLVGLSQNGTSAVLARTERRTTSIAIVSQRRQTTVYFPGNHWSFEAVAGGSLYLRRNGELSRDQFGGGGNRPIAAVGTAEGFASSSDGRYVFSLTVAAAGAAVVDVLDTSRGVASAIRLPGRGSAGAARTYALVSDPDGRHLWAVSPGYGRVVHIDLLERRVVDAYSFSAGPQNGVAAVAAMSPDGEQIAVADASHVWFVKLSAREVIAGAPHVAIALGWSPDQRHLWAIGERSRVSSLPLR
jgi:hypothetical protein